MLKLFFLTLIGVTVTFFFILFSNNDLKLYAIQYGTSLYHPFHDCKKKNNNCYSFAWKFYIIKYQEKTILIDTGFQNNPLAQKLNIKNYVPPLTLLKQLGIQPKQITDIILTHSHFDHIGSVHLFPNSQIYIQKNELENLLKSSKPNLKSFFKNAKNIVSFNNEYTIYDIFHIRKIGGHTIGSSVVILNHKNKKYIFTGDECYFINNCQKGSLEKTLYNYQKNKKFLESIKKEKATIILTFHDPLKEENIKRIIP